MSLTIQPTYANAAGYMALCGGLIKCSTLYQKNVFFNDEIAAITQGIALNLLFQSAGYENTGSTLFSTLAFTPMLTLGMKLALGSSAPLPLNKLKKTNYLAKEMLTIAGLVCSIACTIFIDTAIGTCASLCHLSYLVVKFWKEAAAEPILATSASRTDLPSFMTDLTEEVLEERKRHRSVFVPRPEMKKVLAGLLKEKTNRPSVTF